MDLTERRAHGRGRGRKIGFLIAVLGVVTALSTPVVGFAQSEQSSNPAPLYFEETGQVLSGAFLDAWFLVGGPDRTGFPVSPPVKVDATWVQWFEYARLEVTSDTYSQAEHQNVTLSHIGSSYASQFGYRQTHPAFKPVGGVGEGGEFFEATGHSIANGFLEAYHESNNAERLGLPISEEFSIGGTIYQFFELGAMSWTQPTGTVLVPVGTMDAMLSGMLGVRAEMPADAEIYTPGFFALRGLYPGERWIEVNISTYTLTAWVGETPVMTTLVVTGAPISPTVVGEFNVYWKLNEQTMSGVGPDGIAYEQEDVPDVMYFFEDWAIHGAYWRSGFGYAASHGCVNVPLQEAQWLYEWASVGTRVVVHA